jgi:hypothetical protein
MRYRRTDSRLTHRGAFKTSAHFCRLGRLKQATDLVATGVSSDTSRMAAAGLRSYTTTRRRCQCTFISASTFEPKLHVHLRYTLPRS